MTDNQLAAVGLAGGAMKYINGLAKSGNHALQKACRLLGVQMDINHTPWPGRKDEDCLFIVRHPKNIMRSSLCVTRNFATPVSLIKAIPNGIMGRPLKECVELFGPWAQHATVIRYEDICTSIGVRAVADWLGVPFMDIAGEIAGEPGKRDRESTWTGNPSDWTTCWNDEVQAAWEANGGPLLEAAYGYG